jgi:hypothetical protein
MPRSDKKDTTCVCCGYKFTRPAKLRQHYQSKKNQCNPPSEISSQKEGRKKANVPRPCSPSPAPIVHAQGKDRRKEKPEPIPISIPQDKNQENDPEAGPGPLTQAYREGQAPIKNQGGAQEYTSEEHF